MNLQPDAADRGRLISFIHLGRRESLLSKKKTNRMKNGWKSNPSHSKAGQLDITDIFLQGVTDADPSLISPAASRIHTTHS